MQCNAPAELFPDIPTAPTDLTWAEAMRDCEWDLLEEALEPLVEEVVYRFETMITRAHAW